MKAPELLTLATAWLQDACPGSIIVPELSVADWGGARVDVAAITGEDVVGVEIKGEGDSPTRLELQGLRYGQVCKRMWLLPTPEGTLAERCKKKRPKGWGVLTAEGGSVSPAVRYQSGDHVELWEPRHSTSLNPWAMCGTLWRDELYDIARLNGIQMQSRAYVQELTDAICEQMPVPKLHDAMIDQLRRREWHAFKKAKIIDTRTPDQKRADNAVDKPRQTTLL